MERSLSFTTLFFIAPQYYCSCFYSFLFWFRLMNPFMSIRYNRHVTVITLCFLITYSAMSNNML